MLRVLIAGCGDVGTRLGLLLHARGCQVWGLRRHAAKVPPEIAPLAADLLVPSSLDGIPADLDFVFFTAAPSEHGERAYRNTYVTGLKNLLRTLVVKSAGLRRIVFASSTSVFGQTGGEWVDETSATTPAGFAGRTLLEAESIVASSRFDETCVRLGGIYGPGRERMIRLVSSENQCVRGAYGNRIHSDDAAGFLASLVTLDSPARLYIAVDDEPALLSDVQSWLADRLGAPKPVLVDPNSNHGGEGRRGRSNKRCRNERMRATGYRLQYANYRAGYAALLEHLEPSSARRHH